MIAKLNSTRARIASELGELKLSLRVVRSLLSDTSPSAMPAESQTPSVQRAPHSYGRAACGGGGVIARSTGGGTHARHSQATRYVLRLLSTIRLVNGDFAEARTRAAEALAIYRALGCERHRAKIIAFVLAGLEFHAGNAELALIHASEGLAAFRALNYTQSNQDSSVICQFFSSI